jgi:tricorn protease-like protein
LNQIVTDMRISNDETKIIFCSLSPQIRIHDINSPDFNHEIVILTSTNQEQPGSPIVTVSFSNDQNQIYAGNKAHELLIYDMISQKVSFIVKDSH